MFFSKTTNQEKKNYNYSNPDLVLYYPLESSILSVSIRFMGLILLILIIILLSVFIFSKIIFFNIKLLYFILLFIIYMIMIATYYHIQNSLSHFNK